VTVGLLGSIASVHASLAIAAASFVSVATLLFARKRYPVARGVKG
jgi:hypothetical protein